MCFHKNNHPKLVLFYLQPLEIVEQDQEPSKKLGSNAAFGTGRNYQKSDFRLVKVVRPISFLVFTSRNVGRGTPRPTCEFSSLDLAEQTKSRQKYLHFFICFPVLSKYCSAVTKYPVMVMLRSVAIGKLEVRDRKSELPTCLHSDKLGTFNSGKSNKRDRIKSILFLFRTRST